MMKQKLKLTGTCLFLVFALAQTACSIKVASDNNISGNQIASNNLNGLGGLPAAAGAAALPANKTVPLLPASVSPAAEQARVRNVITAMSQSNNPFAEVAISDHSAPSRVVASYQPVNAPEAAGNRTVTQSNSAPSAPARSAATTVAQESHAAPTYGMGAAGNATR